VLLVEESVSGFLLREPLREPLAKRTHLLVDAPPFARRKLAGGGDERLEAVPPARRTAAAAAASAEGREKSPLR
jgi:hypothetical protein